LAKIRDVAERAGLSAATVSRVINGHPTVSPELAERVRSVIAEMGYQPNRVARNLRRRVSGVWAIVIGDIENPFFTSMVRGVEDVARACGYSVLLCNSDEDVTKEQNYINVLLAEQVAGVIIAPASGVDSSIDPLVASGVAVVAIDRRPSGRQVDTVLSNHIEGARQATAHLIDQGYQRVAFVGGPAPVTTVRERLVGYRAALRDAGSTSDPDLVVHADFRESGGYEAMQRLLAVSGPPDAVLVANNLMAIGTLRALAEADLKAPTDVGVVAFDDHPWATLMRPSLTVVAQPLYEIGRKASELLRSRLADRDRPPESVVLRSELRIRESSLRQSGVPDSETQGRAESA
jgi:LacI family transcriptional regulator